MNDILSEEQQQIESIKNWIQEHYLSLIAVVVVFSAIVFGPDLYQSYKNGKIFPPSDTYEQFNLAVIQASQGAVATDNELQVVDNLADVLVEEYGDSHYAYLTSLRAAKLSADLGHYEVALARLQWAEKHTGNEADQQLVNHRLALVEAQLGNTKSALNRLASPNTHFAALYAETTGDIHASLDQRDLAIDAYETSVEAHETAKSNTQNVTLKLNNLLNGLGSITESVEAIVATSVATVSEDGSEETNSEEASSEQ